MASKKHQKLIAEGGSDRHHFYWPKKLYGGKNPIMELPYGLHHGYHGHFMARCKQWERRLCRNATCHYAEMCCYHGQEVDWGRRVQYGTSM